MTLFPVWPEGERRDLGRAIITTSSDLRYNEEATDRAVAFLKHRPASGPDVFWAVFFSLTFKSSFDPTASYSSACTDSDASPSSSPASSLESSLESSESSLESS